MAKTFFTFLVLTLFAFSFLNRIQASSQRVLLQQYGYGQYGGGGGNDNGGGKGDGGYGGGSNGGSVKGGGGGGDSCDHGYDMCGGRGGYGGRGPICPFLGLPWFNNGGHGPWGWLKEYKTSTQARAPNTTP